MTEKVTIQYLKETGFREQMKQQAEPYLRKYRRSGFFSSYDGTQIFYCTYVPEHPKACIVISHGFSEFAEKYNEAVFYFLQAGYAVFLPEHRGHGRSQRVLRNMEKVYTVGTECSRKQILVIVVVVELSEVRSGADSCTQL